MLEENICNFIDHTYFQMIKQKVYLLLENLDQLKNLKIGSVTELLF